MRAKNRDGGSSGLSCDQDREQHHHRESNSRRWQFQLEQQLDHNHDFVAFRQRFDHDRNYDDDSVCHSRRPLIIPSQRNLPAARLREDFCCTDAAPVHRPGLEIRAPAFAWYEEE